MADREPQSPDRKKGKEKVQRLLETGDRAIKPLEKIIDEQKRMSEATGNEARAVVADAEREPAPSKLLHFAKAREFLSAHGIDLEAKRVERVKDALRWGEVTKRAADKFGASFDAAEVSEADLKAVVKRLEAKPNLKQRVILGIDNATPEQGFDIRIVKARIRNHIWQRFSDYRRVNPKTRKPLENQQPTGKAGITFLPQLLNLPPELRNISPNDQLNKMKYGTKYLGPNGYMIWFRQCLDEGIRALYPEVNIDKLSPADYRKLIEKAILNKKLDPYLPDTETGTQFSDLRHKDDGAVPDLYFLPHSADRKVVLNDSDPGNPLAGFGGRDALGTFLS